MNALFILEHFYPHVGGAEKLSFDLTTALVNSGINVKVATSNSGGYTGKKIIKGVEVYYFAWPSFFGHPVPKLENLIQFDDWCDFVHTSTYTAALVAKYFAQKYHKKIIITVYENLGRKWFLIERGIKALGFFIFEYLSVHKNYDLYHALSIATKNDLITSGIKAQKIHVIYPVFSDFKLNNTDEKPKFDRPYFIYYGRPGKTKGVFILLEAIKQLKKTESGNFVFKLVLSDDPLVEKRKIIQFVIKNCLQDTVKVLDSVDRSELNILIQNAEAVIVPSITEGFGYSAYEASMLNKPLIVSDAGSLPEVVSGKVLFFKSRDIYDLKNKLIMALNHTFQTIPLKRFSPQNQIHQLITMYHQLHS